MQAWFASPDPFIPDATATQSYNRYSYCINNPLKYTDPSGYIDKPADWNKGNSGALYVNPYFNAGYTHIGPGSGNHWSDQYRTPYFNFMIGSPDGFDRIYGIGAWATALSVITNPNLEWVSGEGKKPGIYVKEVKYHFNGWKGDISSGFTADGESEVINRFIPFFGRENGETAAGQGGASGDPTYNNVNTGLGAFSIGWNTKGIMIQGAVAEARGISMAKVNNISNIRTLGATGAGYMKVVKGVSTGANLLGAGMTIADGYVNGFQAHHAADLGIQAAIYGIGASVPVAGWIVGGAYFLGDMYFQSTHNGMSITQYYLDGKR